MEIGLGVSLTIGLAIKAGTFFSGDFGFGVSLTIGLAIKAGTFFSGDFGFGVSLTIGLTTGFNGVTGSFFYAGTFFISLYGTTGFGVSLTIGLATGSVFLFGIAAGTLGGDLDGE